MLDTGDGGLVSIGICEDPASLEELDRLLAGWLAASPHRPPQICTGKVIVQKGL